MASHYDEAADEAGLEEHALVLDGDRVAYVEGGDGPSIVLLHGYAGQKTDWYALARFLTQRHHVVAFDLPPFGESTLGSEAMPSVSEQVARVGRILDGLKLERVHLVGSSMGGHIAGLFAARHPERVRSLTLMNTAGVPSPVKSALAQAFDRGENPFHIEDQDDLERFFALVFERPPEIPGPVMTYLLDERRANNSRNEAYMAAYRESFVPLTPALSRIEAPTLVVWGAQDRMIDVSTVEVLQRRLRDVQVEIIDECGHAPMIEYPRRTAQRLATFVDEVEAQASQAPPAVADARMAP